MLTESGTVRQAGKPDTMHACSDASPLWKDRGLRVMVGGSLTLKEVAGSSGSLDGIRCSAHHPVESIIAVALGKKVVEVDSISGLVVRSHIFSVTPTWIAYSHHTARGWDATPSLLVALIDWSFRLLDPHTGAQEVLAGPRKEWASKPLSHPLVTVSPRAPLLVYALHGHAVPRARRISPLSASQDKSGKAPPETKLRLAVKQPIQGLAIHPGTSKHLLVLTADRFLRAYDIFSRLTEPVAAFELSLDPTPPPPSRILLHGPSSQPNALQFCPEPLGKDAQHAALAICDGSLHLLSVPIQALSSAAPLTQSAGSFPMGTARITPLGSVSVSGTSLLGAGFSCCTHGVFALAVLRDSFSGSLSVCAVPVRWDASLGVRADLPREGPLVPLRLSFPQGEALAASVDPKRLSFFVTAGSGGNGEVPHGGATRSTGKVTGSYGRPVVRAGQGSALSFAGALAKPLPALVAVDLVPAWRPCCGSLVALAGSPHHQCASWLSTESVDLCQVGLHISEHSLMQFNMSTGESDVLCPLPDANSQGRIHAVTQVVASVRTHSALVFTEPSVSQDTGSGEPVMEFSAFPLSETTSAGWFAPGVSGCFLTPDDAWVAVLDPSMKRVLFHRRIAPSGPFSPSPALQIPTEPEGPASIFVRDRPILQPDLMPGPRSRGARLMWVSRGHRLALGPDLSHVLGEFSGEDARKDITGLTLAPEAWVQLGGSESVVQVAWQDLSLGKDEELYAEIDALRRPSGSGGDSDSESGSGSGDEGEGQDGAGLGGRREGGLLGSVGGQESSKEGGGEKKEEEQLRSIAAVLTNERLLIIDDDLLVIASLSLRSHPLLAAIRLRPLPVSSIAWAGPALLLSTADARVLHFALPDRILPLCSAAASPEAPVLVGSTPDRVLLLRPRVASPAQKAARSSALLLTGPSALGPAHPLQSVDSLGSIVSLDSEDSQPGVSPGVVATQAAGRAALLGGALLAGLAGMGRCGVAPMKGSAFRTLMRQAASAWDASRVATADLLWALSDCGCADLSASIAAAALDTLGPIERAATSALAGLWDRAAGVALDEFTQSAYDPLLRTSHPIVQLSRQHRNWNSADPPPEASFLRAVLSSAAQGTLEMGKFGLAFQLSFAAGDPAAAATVAMLRGDGQALEEALGGDEEHRAVRSSAGEDTPTADGYSARGSVSLAQQGAGSGTSILAGGPVAGPGSARRSRAFLQAALARISAAGGAPAPPPGALADGSLDWPAVVLDPASGPVPADRAFWELAAVGTVPVARCLTSHEVPVAVPRVDFSEPRLHVGATPATVVPAITGPASRSRNAPGAFPRALSMPSRRLSRTSTAASLRSEHARPPGKDAPPAGRHRLAWSSSMPPGGPSALLDSPSGTSSRFTDGGGLTGDSGHATESPGRPRERTNGSGTSSGRMRRWTSEGSHSGYASSAASSPRSPAHGQWRGSSNPTVSVVSGAAQQPTLPSPGGSSASGARLSLPPAHPPHPAHAALVRPPHSPARHASLPASPGPTLRSILSGAEGPPLGPPASPHRRDGDPQSRGPSLSPSLSLSVSTDRPSPEPSTPQPGWARPPPPPLDGPASTVRGSLDAPLPIPSPSSPEVGTRATQRRSTGAMRQISAVGGRGLQGQDGSDSDSDSDDAPSHRRIPGQRLQLTIRAPSEAQRTDDVTRSKQLRTMMSGISLNGPPG